MNKKFLYITLLIASFAFQENCYEIYQKRVNVHKENCKAGNWKFFNLNMSLCSLRLNSMDNSEEKKAYQNSCLMILAIDASGLRQYFLKQNRQKFTAVRESSRMERILQAFDKMPVYQNVSCSDFRQPMLLTQVQHAQSKGYV